jgi:cytochrome c553
MTQEQEEKRKLSSQEEAAIRQAMQNVIEGKRSTQQMEAAIRATSEHEPVELPQEEPSSQEEVLTQ